MTLKKYKRIKLILTIIIAIIFSQSIIHKNFIIPVITLIISTLILLQLHSKVKEIMADERDYKIAGKSALFSIQIFSWIAVVIMFAALAFQDYNPMYSTIGNTLAFSVCALMITYSITFRYHHGK